MTMRTPIEGVTAPLPPLDRAAYAQSPATIVGADDRPRSWDDDTPIEDFAAQAARDGPCFMESAVGGPIPGSASGALTGSRKSGGWTPDRQRAFLDYIAGGLTVGDASTLVGLSAASAYAFRARAAGAAFAVGWQAALLLQRNRLVDELTSRAFRGQSETVTRPDGSTIERHRFDNRLALALLTRLDKVAAADLPDRTGDARAARLAAQDWDRYLDLIAGDASPAQAGMFLALRVTEGESEAVAPIVALARADLYRRTGAGHRCEIDTTDLDPAHRADWTAAQWARAEAAGLVALAPAPVDPDVDAREDEAAGAGEDTPGKAQHSQHWRDDGHDSDPVWWCDTAEDWRTRFPPPADFSGDESGDYGEEDYERGLTDDELAAWDAPVQRDLDRRRPVEEGERDAFFAALMLADMDDEADDETEGSAGGDEAGHAAAHLHPAPPSPRTPAVSTGAGLQ